MSPLRPFAACAFALLHDAGVTREKFVFEYERFGSSSLAAQGLQPIRTTTARAESGMEIEI